MFVKRVAPFRETWRISAWNYDSPHDYSTEELLGIGALSKKFSSSKQTQGERNQYCFSREK